MSGTKRASPSQGARRRVPRPRPAAPALYLLGPGWLAFDGTIWRPVQGPAGFAWPSFDGRSLGGHGRTTARGKGAVGDRHGVGQFIDRCTEPAPGERVASAALLAAVNDARRQAGRDPVTSRALADELKRRGVRQTKSSCVWWLGIKLVPRPPPRAPPRRPRRSA